MTRTIRAFLTIATGVAAWAVPHWAQAGFPELLRRLPSDTNTVVVVNLDSVMQTPLAKQLDWMAKWEDAFDAGPTPFPAGTSRALVGAYYVPSKRDAQWKVAMMDMRQEIDLPAVARSEGGYPDRIWDKDGVVSPLDVIFIKVQPNTLAGIEPADRPFALKWLQNPSTQGPASPFITGIVRSMGASSQVTMAMDMTDMFSAPNLRRNMAMAPFQALGEKADLDLWCNFLASIQNVRFDATVTDQIKGRVVVTFGIDAVLLKSNGKALLIEVLDRAGMSLPDLAEWKATVDEKTFTVEGPLTPQSLRGIVNIIGLPAPASADPTASQASDDPAVVAKTSSRYFRSISGSIDQLRANGSYQTAKTWLTREAQRIERLPIVNVDPELVGWGGEVASRLRQAAGSLAYDEQNNVAKVMNVQSSGSYSFSYNGGNGYWGSGGYGANYNDPYQGRGTNANLEWQRQRAQIHQQGKADAIKNVQEIWGKIGADRDKMRAKMVERYKVEF